MDKQFYAKAGGFQLTFDNGYSLSVQFGPGAYGDHHRARGALHQGYESDTAETAILTPDGKFLPYNGDNVQAYQSFSDFLKILDFVRNLPSD